LTRDLFVRSADARRCADVHPCSFCARRHELVDLNAELMPLLEESMSKPIELLKAEDIAKMEGKSRAHLLNPDAIRISKSIGDVTGLTDLGFQLMTVMPGHEYAEYHRHLYEEQCFYILSGSGEAIIEGKRYVIDSGDFLEFPKNGVAHTIANNGDAPLVMISARTNLEQDICEYPRKKKRLYMNGSEEALVDFDDVRFEPPAGEQRP
jgi:uncharacterized cupin superfamily protein